MGSAALACLLVLWTTDDPVAVLVDRLHEDPMDEKSWTALARCDEPGEALQAVRRLVDEDPESPDAWHVLWQLADRVGDFPLATEASRHALELLAKEELLERANREEDALSEEFYRRGLTLAERQALVRRRAIRVRLGLATTKTDERIERIDLEVRQRAHPDPERLRAAIEAARAREDELAEHGLQVELAYDCWATERFREGREAFQRVLAIDASQSRAQRANDQNGAARLALELALTCSGAEREALLRETLDHARIALAEHADNHVGGPADLVRDHCVLAHAQLALGDEAAALVHFEAELALVLAQRQKIAIEGDQALRIFHSAEDHIFQDFALFLARAGPGSGGNDRPADLPRALATSELGRVGALKELFRLRGLPSPSWTDQVQPLAELEERAKKSKTAVVVYCAGSHEAAAICIADGGLSFHPLAPPRELDRAAEALARVAFDLTAKDAAIEQAGREAYDLFVAPLASTLAGARRLVFVGAGRWGRLPFGALVAPAKDASEPLTARYLAARHELAFAPTLGVLTAERAPTGEGAPVSFGYDGAGAFDPELAAHFGLAGLAPLARAETESRAVADELRGAAVVGSSATEAAFRERAAGAALVHFAGHALVDDEDGTRSALVLAPSSGGGDGLLTLGEILELRTTARLVILSACRTARGDSYSGEGVGGIARCFLAAGAQDLLVSLAPVDDAQAPVFIGHLTQALADGSHPATALALAQRGMLAKKSSAHPALWASFVLHGQADLLR